MYKGRKTTIESLSLHPKASCNLKCAFCLRGDSTGIAMNLETINNAFEGIDRVHVLYIGGGEVALAINQLEAIFDIANDKKIDIRLCSVVLNGTLYTHKLEAPFTKFAKTHPHFVPVFELSNDFLHRDEIEKSSHKEKYLENIEALKSSEYYTGSRDEIGYILREGRGETYETTLPTHKFVPSWQPTFSIYNGENYIRRASVSPQGFLTEHDCSYEHMETLYNYANINREGGLVAACEEYANKKR